MSSSYVVDASVVMKLFISEEQSSQAIALFGQLAQTEGMKLYAPDLLYIECANVFCKYTERYGYPRERASKNLRRLALLSLRWVSVYELFSDAYTLAIDRSITAYDACYLLLSHKLKVSFITADKKLLAIDPVVIWLGNYPYE